MADGPGTPLTKITGYAPGQNALLKRLYSQKWTFDFKATVYILRVVLLLYASFQNITVYFAMPRKLHLKTIRLLKASTTNNCL